MLSFLAALKEDSPLSRSVLQPFVLPFGPILPTVFVHLSGAFAVGTVVFTSETAPEAEFLPTNGFCKQRRLGPSGLKSQNDRLQI